MEDISNKQDLVAIVEAVSGIYYDLKKYTKKLALSGKRSAPQKYHIKRNIGFVHNQKHFAIKDLQVIVPALIKSILEKGCSDCKTSAVDCTQKNIDLVYKVLSNKHEVILKWGSAQQWVKWTDIMGKIQNLIELVIWKVPTEMTKDIYFSCNFNSVK